MLVSTPRCGTGASSLNSIASRKAPAGARRWTVLVQRDDCDEHDSNPDAHRPAPLFGSHASNSSPAASAVADDDIDRHVDDHPTSFRLSGVRGPLFRAARNGKDFGGVSPREWPCVSLWVAVW